MRIAGIGRKNTRVIPHDANFAMVAEELEKQVLLDKSHGLCPFWICSSVGTTSSGACDPTRAIAEIAKTHGLWLHVDAAMQGMAALVPEHRDSLHDGVELADSYCTNPHKWMGINFDCDLFWTADRRALISALSILPEFLRSAAALSGGAIDYRDWQIPLGRRFRSLKLWFAVRTEGVAVFQEMIRRHVRWTQDLAVLVKEDDRFEVAAPHPLNLLCVRVKGESVEDGNKRTDALIEKANATRSVLFTRTVLDGKSVLRFSIGGRSTEWRHVEAAWETLKTLVA